MNLFHKMLSPYEKPKGKENVFDLIDKAAVEGRELTVEDWRQIAFATYVRLENHERVCKIRGGIMIFGLLVVILRLFEDTAWAVLTGLGQIGF